VTEQANDISDAMIDPNDIYLNRLEVKTLKKIFKNSKKYYTQL